VWLAVLPATVLMSPAVPLRANPVLLHARQVSAHLDDRAGDSRAQFHMTAGQPGAALNAETRMVTTCRLPPGRAA
jgi:hypothetical protein